MSKIKKSVLLYPDQETIVACCTSQGSGALAIIRLSGNDSFVVATKISRLTENKKLSLQQSHTIHYGWIVDKNGDRIDQVLFFVMQGPKTFTGQNTIEISCHNNPFIIEAIIEQAIFHGARLAQQGEFTKRALLNNKIDLLQAEAINELINAHTSQALRLSLQQLEGSFSSWIANIEKQLLSALAFSEASFEFIDEEDMTFGSHILEIITNVQHSLVMIKSKFNQQQQIRNGIRIAIIGSVNAGKSSLFNTLLAQDRAIVTNIAGTTRDVIEAGLYRNGSYWTLIDTAGLRTTDNIIEQVGIKKSYEQAHLADIIILAIDPSLDEQEKTINTFYHEMIDRYNKKIICVQTKYDISNAITSYAQSLGAQTSCGNAIQISNTTKHNITALEHAIVAKINEILNNSESPFLLNQRHFNVLLGLENKLEQIRELLDANIQYELVSYHLNDALASIGELTGKSISEMGMDAVFRNFCIGK
jgi:tRNA modification GTPase